MAVTKTKPKLNVVLTTGKSAAPATGTTVPETEVKQPTTAAPSLSRDFFVGMFKQLCTLSDAGRQYIDTLVKLLKTESKRSIDVFSINDSIAGECYAVIDVATNVYVLLMFTESYTTSNVPIADRAPAVHNTITSTKKGADGGRLKIIQSIVVDAETGDYARADRMAAHINNLFVAYDERVSPTAAIYTKMRLVPNTNLRSVKDYIDRRSPHAVQDRVDWGVVLEYESQSDVTKGYQTTDTPVRTPMMAVGGYTKFVVDYSSNPIKIYPICVISNVTSDIPVADILNIALPVAAGVAIRQLKWQTPYTQFGKDQPNLGYFFNDPESKSLKFYTSLDEVNASINSSFMPPMLAIDIPEGRAHLPQLEKLYDVDVMAGTYSDPNNLDPTKDVKIAVNAPTRDIFLNNISCSFYAGVYKYFMPATMSSPFINYEGNVLLGGKRVDTRTCDYLNIVALTKTMNPATSSFLVQSPIHDARVKNIQQIVGEDAVKITYRSITVMINPVYVNRLADILSSIVNYVNPTNLDQSIPLINNINAVLQTPISGDNSVYGGYTYTNQIRNIYS